MPLSTLDRQLIEGQIYLSSKQDGFVLNCRLFNQEFELLHGLMKQVFAVQSRII